MCIVRDVTHSDEPTETASLHFMELYSEFYLIV